MKSGLKAQLRCLIMKNKNVPEIRFSGYKDEWKPSKFEDLLDKKNGVRRGPFGSALKKEIFVQKSDYVVYEQQNAIYNHYETRYNIPESKFKELRKFSLTQGDFIMSGAGTIGRISRVPKGIKQGVFNQALIRFKINNEVTDSEYFIQFVRAENMQKKLTGANPGSAITNLVPMSEVKKWDILIPSRHEQQKIGAFLKQFDNAIAIHQHKLNILKQTKQGFLQKMFPNEGESVPELRFPGFTDDWELRKLNKLAKFSKGKGYTKNDLKSNGKEIILYGRLYTKYETEIIDIDTFVESDAGAVKSEQGDVIVPASGETSKDISRASVVVKEGIILGGDLNIIKTKKEELSPVFLSLTISNGSQQKELIKRAQGKSVVHLHNSDLEKVSVNMPSIEEQQKIGAFFKQLDYTIALHQRELDLLKETKKGFLQKLFV